MILPLIVSISAAVLIVAVIFFLRTKMKEASAMESGAKKPFLVAAESNRGGQ